MTLRQWQHERVGVEGLHANGLQFYPSLVVKTIDAHVGGQPCRLIIDGMPSPRGSTMYEKQVWASRHADHVRRLTLLEPRGHRDLSAAVLTEPVAPGSHAGVIFMRSGGYQPMSAHGIVAVVTIARERGLIDPGDDGQHIVLDTVAGTIRADLELQQDRASGATIVAQVSFTNVPSFVVRPGIELSLGSRRVRTDIVFGGRFYAIVDSESAGVSLDLESIPELRRAGRAITTAARASGACVHPGHAHVSEVGGTVFTSPPHDGSADLRTVTVLADGSVDRSAGGTGIAAVMAVLDAMGFLSDAAFVAESLIGSTLRARRRGRTTVGDHEAIVSIIEGRAWIIGDSLWHAPADDPLANRL
jgi:proline racemase